MARRPPSGAGVVEAGASTSFTRSFPGISLTLLSDCMVSANYNPSEQEAIPNPFPCLALWDTGSTGCMVSQSVVSTCGLHEYERAPIFNASGTVEDVPRYMVNLYLPNGLVVRELLVALGEFEDFDVLIGMDVITLGDLAVTNANGQTTFTFRVPSQGIIDFTAE